MRYVVFFAVLVLFSGCSDSPNSPSGSLPVVQNCRILETESKGDTVFVAWDAVSVEVDGYRVWFAETDPGDWEIIAQIDSTVVQHIANGTGYYCVDAIQGIDSSSDHSDKADDRAEMHVVSDTMFVSGTNGIRFEASATIIGDAAESGFAQDLYIAKSSDTMILYRGNTDPMNYPGGTNSLVASASGRVAPEPGDSDWLNSLPALEGKNYFVQLESGDYAYFNVDTVTTDFVVVSTSQYQAITGLRLFNQFLF